MKQIRSMLVCLLVAGAGLTFCRAQSTPVQSAPVQSTPAQQQESPASCQAPEKGARLVLPVNTYNFGNVPRKGGNLEKEFVFRNEGTAPLVIVRVLTSCSCFKATFPKRPVAPGQEGVIRIVYEPLKSEPGTFNKVLQIYSNSVTGRELLTVQGNSVE